MKHIPILLRFLLSLAVCALALPGTLAFGQAEIKGW